MSKIIDISHKSPTKDEIGKTVDELIYANYKWNRQKFPQHSPERYKCIFGNMVETMEQRYQLDIVKGDK